MAAALATLDSAPLLTTTEAAAYLQIRSVNTLKLLIRQLNVPHERHGNRMMVPISALDALRREAIVRGIQASDRGHAALADFDGDAALSDEQLEALEHGRPGTLPWRAQRPPAGQRA